MDWKQSLKLLSEGNQRFVSGKLRQHEYDDEDLKSLKEGQEPYAVILCCSDSRVSPEILFDEELGNLFVIRNAGNVSSDNVFASIEYPIKNLGSKLVVVMGHSDCGAVTAAFNKSDLDGYLKPSIQKITDVISEAKSLSEAIEMNTEAVADEIREVIEAQNLDAKVVSAYETIGTGHIEFKL